MQEKINKLILLIIIGGFYSAGIGFFTILVDFIFNTNIWYSLISLLLSENPLLRIISIPIFFLIIGLLGELIFPLIGEKKRFTFIDAFQNYSKTKKKSAKDYIKAVDKLSEDMDKIERINRPLTVKIKDFFDEYKTYIILFIILAGASVLLTP